MNNFVSVFEELSKLYEADELEQDTAAEAAEGAEVSNTTADDEPKQLVLECAKCGTLVVKAEEDVVVDEATDLANVEEACTSCEEVAGFKVLGELLPYTTDKTIEVEEAEEAAEPEEFEESVEPTTDKKSSACDPDLEKDCCDEGCKKETSEQAINEELLESVLTEGKFMDNVKKVITRVGADAATIGRSFAELGDEILNIGNNGEWKSSKLSDFMEYVENKAVLKALLNGNETVLNTCTKEDIEELAKDIEDYKKAKVDDDADDAEADAK